MIGEILIVLALILANGFFSGAEMAIVASRRGRLRQMADAGDPAARTALDLASSPDRFLPTVQIGITLVGTLAAAYGGDRLVSHLADWLGSILPPGMAGAADNHVVDFTAINHRIGGKIAADVAGSGGGGQGRYFPMQNVAKSASSIRSLSTLPEISP